MNDHAITLVRESLDLLEPIAARAGAAFYLHLMRTDPALERLLRVDLEAEGARLMRVVDSVAQLLDQPDSLQPRLQDLGRKLAAHGFRDEHYATFLDALLATLKEQLGAAYTPELEDAWRSVYAGVSSTLQRRAAVAA